MKRRDFVKHAAAMSALAWMPPLPEFSLHDLNWNAGQVDHILPTANHERFLIKISLREQIQTVPVLTVGRTLVNGQKTDSQGFFWTFDVTGLQPATEYELSLTASKKPLCDSWKLKTFPAPGDLPDRLRVLIYTCAGGHDRLRAHEGRRLLSPKREKLLTRALSYRPDALIAIGDQVYWDLRGNGAARKGLSAAPPELAMPFDRDKPVVGTPNELALRDAAGPQIVPLYSTRLRSTPVFFFHDDHDYFENDEASDYFISFPPDPFNLELSRTLQSWYYPEFLPDHNRPANLGGSSAGDKAPGVSECFGTLRYGRLAELLMYDCRRFLSLKGPTGQFVPQETERWISRRVQDNEVLHTVNIPSTPMGWTAGKWGEWYPDYLNVEGKLTDHLNKPYWQSGWNSQHDRILRAISGNQRKIPLMISGDLHAIGATRIQQSNMEKFGAHPIVSILAGPLGADGWPSGYRGTKPLPPKSLDVAQDIEALEENGFVLVDFTPGTVEVHFFRFSPDRDSEDLIADLLPFKTLTYNRHD